MKMLPWKTGNVGEKDQKVRRVRKCHEKMMFYLFLGPLEGLKSRPSHHCLFSSDLAQPKKLCTQTQFLRAQTHWFWPPTYFWFSTSLLQDALRICRMTWSGCGTNWSAIHAATFVSSLSQHRNIKSHGWLRFSAKVTSKPSIFAVLQEWRNIARGASDGWYIHCEKSSVFERFGTTHFQ